MENNNTRLSIVALVKSFEGAFDYVNERFYDGAIPAPVITIAEGAKARAYGWVSVPEVWHDKETNTAARELNIASDYLNRDFTEVVRTLLHECVHLENLRNGVQDTARAGSRHNKEFRKCAEEHGLEWHKPETDAEKAYYEKYGFSDVRLVEALEEEVYNAEAIKALKEALTLYRDVSEKGSKKKSANVLKYICPSCGCSCRATKELNIVCADCDCTMEIG